MQTTISNGVDKNLTLFIFTLFSLLLFTNSFAKPGDHDITLIYTGNLDGELEPCGCSEGGNKGGIKRRVNAIDKLREEDRNLYLISAGGLLVSDMPQDKLKSEYLLKGLAAVSYDAIGVQWRDLAYGTQFLTDTKLPFIISNKAGDAFFTEKQMNNNHAKLAFFSWLDPNSSPQKNMKNDIVTTDTSKLAAALEKAKSGRQLTILSSTLSLKQAQKKLPLDNVDILIVKAKYELYGQPKKTNNILVLQPGSRGMRIGKLKLTVTKLGEISHWQHEVIALPPETGDAPRMADWYTQYNEKVKEDYQKRVEIRKALESGVSPYAGEASCKTCHAKQHDLWFNSRHAEAFYALQDANKAFDPNCIICHTVGFEKKGGFIDPAITENLMHVQCENCHGAARKHVESGGQTPVPNKDWPKEKICSQCHIQKHSPDFKLEKYWPKVAH